MLPCYNPQPLWADRVISQYALLKQKIEGELSLILVNDGSTKNVTDADISKLSTSIEKFDYISYDRNIGKGYALRKGVSRSSSEVIIYTDIDFPYTINSILSIYNHLCDNIDVAVGVKDNNYYSRVPILRRYISKALRTMTGIFFKLPVTDTQCGLKGFNTKGKESFLNSQTERYLFDLEFLCIAHNSNCSIVPVEVELNKHVSFSSMNYMLLLPELKNFLRIFRNKS